MPSAGDRAMPAPSTQVLRIDALARPNQYHEFLRTGSMSAGAYVLGPGATDRQRPHSEDEVYYVVRGRGRFRHGEQDDLVGSGDVLFVPAREEHRFHDVSEELVLLVFFAPPEGSSG
jgi:mannose-6-phosphate isomerase-like protein (cupin superfamily)